MRHRRRFGRAIARAHVKQASHRRFSNKHKRA